MQLSLLTRAQLRAAASIPRAIADSRKWLEQHLAEYRRQTQSLLDGFNQIVRNARTRDFETALSLRAQLIENAAKQIQSQHDDAKFVAKIKSLMESAASQWEVVKADTAAQCKQLGQVSDELRTRSRGGRLFGGRRGRWLPLGWAIVSP